MYKLKIKNYQVIKDTEINFLEGMTLITGKSNNGKSSILKAFKQCVYNTSGKDYIRHGTTQTQISLSTPEDVNIEYKKGLKESKYIIEQADKTTKEYTKLGASQLDEIKNITKIDKELGFNFWDQLDKPFLLNSSPKETFDTLQTSKYTEILYDIQQEITTDRKRTQTTLIQEQAQLDLVQEQMKPLEKTKELLKLYGEEITPKLEQLDLISKEIGNLEELLKALMYLNLSIATLENKEKVYKGALLSELERIKEENNVDLDLLDGKYKSVINLGKIIEDTTEKKQIYENINLIDLQTSLNTSYVNKNTIVLTYTKHKEFLYKQSIIDKLTNLLQGYKDLVEVDEIIKQGATKLNFIKSSSLILEKLNATLDPVQTLLNNENSMKNEIDRIKVFKDTYFKVCPLCGRSSV